MKTLRRHARRIWAIILNGLVNHDVIFLLLGLINRKHPFIGAVFLVYPASKQYALEYCYASLLDRFRWSPGLAGIYRQGKQWGLMMAISGTEEDFLMAENLLNLEKLLRRVERIQELIGAPQRRFAGILPGLMYSRQLTRNTIEADVTVECVVRAERQVRYLEKLSDITPIIILGSKGYIGRNLIGAFSGRDVYGVDVKGDILTQYSWPTHLAGGPAILINVTKAGALSHYLDLFWPKLVFLNEVYPPPSRNEVRTLSEMGSPIYHVVGVKAVAYPRFPGAYSAGVPCCASQVSDDMEIIVRKLA